MSDLEDAADDAVHALLPILPLRGSEGTGYTPTAAPFSTARALPAEWKEAARAIARLHEELKLAQLDRAQEEGMGTEGRWT